ncbi:hypothetical protein HY477_01975 [Candidatus Uhrbacteria bacterium]|nr:hypothetical protein [Candidatus Uhrbacteria bacterium]
MKKRLIITIAALAAVFGFVFFMRIGNFGTAALWSVSYGGTWMFPLVSVAALIDSINPCAFSVLILTIAFLLSIGNLRGRVLRIGSIYILGLFLTYIAIGLGLLHTLHIFNTPHFMARVGAGLLIVLGGINLVNEFFPAFPLKLRIPHAVHHKMATLMEKGTAPTAFALGVLVGLCEFPCTGGPYLMVLGLLHDQTTYVRGLMYLVWYNLLFILPLVLILAIASDKGLLGKVQAWQKRERKGMRLWGGAAMVVLGLIIFFL